MSTDPLAAIRGRLEKVLVLSSGWSHLTAPLVQECLADLSRLQAARERLKLDGDAAHAHACELVLECRQQADQIAALTAHVEQWRAWAVFVYKGEVGATVTNAELQAAVCAAHDADTKALAAHVEELQRKREVDYERAHANWVKAEAERDTARRALGELPRLSDDDVENIAQGIENFIMDGNPEVDAIWQPYVDKLRALPRDGTGGGEARETEKAK